jgi:hypothetical protein
MVVHRCLRLLKRGRDTGEYAAALGHPDQPVVSGVSHPYRPFRVQTDPVWRDLHLWIISPGPVGTGGSPKAAQVRRSPNDPAATSKAVSRFIVDSATISVRPSGVSTMPLGKPSPSATTLAAPSGSTQISAVVQAVAPPMRSNPTLPTHAGPS